MSSPIAPLLEPAGRSPIPRVVPDSQPEEVIPVWVAAGRVPCLDGLRAVSVTLVILVHLSHTPGCLVGYHPYRQLAATGVDLFFVISGFLITLLLLREHDRVGRVSLRGFYARRALRILPAYLALLLFVTALDRVGAVSMGPGDWRGVLTYTVNFESRPLWDIGHLWSLSVEEHFYLIWPIIFLGFGPRRSLLALVAALAAAPFLRVAMWKWTSLGDHFDLNFITPGRYEVIGYGCLLAFAARHPASWRIGRRAAPLAGPGLLLIVGLILVSELVLWPNWKYSLTIGRTVVAVSITAGLFLCLATPRSLAARALELRPVVLVGALSYSLYLWQQPFLKNSPAWWCQWPQCLVLAAAAAVACHLLVERPFLRLKARAPAACPTKDARTGVG
jgi:peptidoglycan/LPS O-acetylase OafA/YrhL